MSMIETGAARVVTLAELGHIMMEDVSGYNIYIMNITMLALWANDHGIDINPLYAQIPHNSFQILGYQIEMLNTMPDYEIVVIDKTHPNW